MYGSQLILLPDDCSLPVKRQRKRKKTPKPAPVPLPPPQPAPTKCKGFKQEKSTYRISVAPSGRGALSPVSVSHREGGNPTRGLRLREAWALHPALALHRARVH